MIIVVFGLPGSGKTYFAKALAKELKMEHVNTDMLRKKLSSNPMYSEADRAHIYEVLFSEIVKGKDLVVDGTFYQASLRKSVFAKAMSEDHSIFFMEVKASEETVVKRLSEKREDSDADVEVYRKIKSEFEEMNTPHLVVKSDVLTLDQMIETALVYVQGYK